MPLLTKADVHRRAHTIRRGKRVKAGFHFKLTAREARDILYALKEDGRSSTWPLERRLAQELRTYEELTRK